MFYDVSYSDVADWLNYVIMTSHHHDDGIEILATSTTMTSEMCATSHMIDIGLTLVSATTNSLTLNDLEETVMSSNCDRFVERKVKIMAVVSHW